MVLACAWTTVGAVVERRDAPAIAVRVETAVELEEPDEPAETADPLDYTRIADEVELVEVDVPLPPPQFTAPAARVGAVPPDPLARMDPRARIVRRSTAAASDAAAAGKAAAGEASAAEARVTGGGDPLARATEAAGAAAPAGPPVVSKPRPLASNSRPPYPSRARRRGRQGVVVLRVHVSASGDVDEVEIAESSGYGDLDRAARRAALDWRYEPATEDGRAVGMSLLQPIRFQL